MYMRFLYYKYVLQSVYKAPAHFLFRHNLLNIVIQLHVLNLAGLIIKFGSLVARASGATLEIVLKESLFVLDVQQRMQVPQVGPRKHQLWEVRVSLIIVDGFDIYFQHALPLPVTLIASSVDAALEVVIYIIAVWPIIHVHVILA
jgi:hypothetical protein